mmetsp:Transcript_122466/g.381254  ORF Transcript_122466/g.381254 Transcript_122466/m.381254 type:complete len:117 (+) Transcript_122466:234-584(+)
MRQAGVLAAAGMHALDEHVRLLPVDHENARRLGEALGALPGLSVDMSAVQTNIVMVDIAEDARFTARSLVEQLGERGVRAVALPDGRLRLVTHLGVDSDGVDAAVEAVRDVVAAGA